MNMQKKLKASGLIESPKTKNLKVRECVVVLKKLKLENFNVELLIRHEIKEAGIEKTLSINISLCGFVVRNDVELLKLD